ncbi:hypothetical protein KGF54_005305 [Candida jiufengensis]|uniref:uncharacterized protein n=1 Tax=Candida jiufengensis TaxID=497108 RepID=UPI0022241C87|nr:uncharacterized protein KGF54_005305 [Candida jiufengensis]KAI5950157.1 hypothetical protein KGF54_005305 [Candida jiufengensis]
MKTSPIKVPSSIRRIIELFQILSTNQNASYQSKYITNYLHDTSDLSLRNVNWSTMNKNMNGGVFGKYDRNRDQLLFSNPIPFGVNELLDTKSLFKSKIKFNSPNELISKYPKGFKNSNVFINDIKSLVNAYYNPKKSIPINQKYRQIFKYYLQRLNSPTNVMIILKQDQRLFSQSSLENWNQEYIEISNFIRKLNYDDHHQKYKDSFEISKVVDPDILNLSLKSHYLFENAKNLDRSIDQASWDEINTVTDRIADNITENQEMRFMKGKKKVDPSTEDPLLDQQISEVFDLLGKFGNDDLSFILQDFKFDLIYNQFFMLNVLNSKTDYSQILEYLHKHSSFDVIGIKENNLVHK